MPDRVEIKIPSCHNCEYTTPEFLEMADCDSVEDAITLKFGCESVSVGKKQLLKAFKFFCVD